MANRRADLHTHTSASDGTGSLRDLIKAAESRHMSIVAVTDHNTVESAREACSYMQASEEHDGCDVRVIPGIEVSSGIDPGDGMDIVHIIGLGIDPMEGALVSLCDDLREKRLAELRRRIDYVESLGYELDPAVKEKVLREAFWGKGDLARALFEIGRFDSIDSAYHALWDTYESIGPGAEGYAAAGDAIAAIHASGGLSVLAHPYRDEVARASIARWKVVERLEALEALGLDAVEAYYRTCPIEECEWLEGFAKERHLLVSAGSDHHDSFPGMRRFRMGMTAADGNNYGHRASVLGALGF